MLNDRINLKDLEERLANATPLLAAVGAGDLAVEKLRAAREELIERASTFDAKAFRDSAQATITNRVEALQAELATAPEQLRALPEKAQDLPAKAQSLFADALSIAFSTYGELAGRGKHLVDQVRPRVPAGLDVEAETPPVSRPAPNGTNGSSAATAARSSTVKSSAVKSSAVKSNTAKPNAAKPNAAKPGSVKSNSVKSNSVKSNSVKSNTVKPRTAAPMTSQTTSAPAKSAPAKPAAAKSGPGKRTASKTTPTG